MNWQDVRKHYPEQWLLIEAIEAHSEGDRRILDRIAVIDPYPDSAVAMRSYGELHRKEPHRELLVLHTSRETLDITEIRWAGIRGLP
jgi:hypothetical protein